MSGIDTSVPGSEPSMLTAETNNTPLPTTKRSNNLSDDIDDSTSAAKKPKYADFTTKKSDKDSVCSGEDEEKWEKERDKMLEMAAQQRKDDEEAADNMSDGAVENNWGLDGTDDDGIVGEVQLKERTFQWVRFDIKDKGSTAAKLKKILQALSLPVAGKKNDLFVRIRDANHTLINKVDNEVFEYKLYDDEEENLPKWIVLEGTPVADVDGVVMETGATEGFYNPTNPDMVDIGGKLKQFLTGEEEKIPRPSFAKRPSTTDDPSLPHPDPPPDYGGPSDDAKKLIGDVRCARPISFLWTQITDDFVASHMVNTTNARAIAEGEVAVFVPFDKEEIYKFIGFFLANGLSPHAPLESWFSTDWLLGNEVMTKALEKKGYGGITISAKERLRQFRRLLCIYDCRENAREEIKKDPLYKVRPILKELNCQARKMWRTGRWVAIDEQTIGFKGKHGMKLRISYKREGDGFQCDALCDNGYTFSFYFRHGDAHHWMRQKKWWWAIFLWAIGVGVTNAWLIYSAMYDEEKNKQVKSKKTVDLPPKWTHSEFIRELIEDMLFPDESKRKVEEMKAAAKTGDASVTSKSTLRSGKSFSSSSSSNLRTDEAVADFLDRTKPDTITKKRMGKGHFSARLDGKRHASIPASTGDSRAHCQYCYYKWGILPDEDAKKQNTWMQQNRKNVRRCLNCNVNLCWLCENEWHGVDMSAV